MDDLDTVLAMLGRSLKGLRQARGWTLTVATDKVASLAGAHISRETLRLYEEGASGIPIRRLFQIAAVYQVSAVGALAWAVEAADGDPTREVPELPAEWPLSGNDLATITLAAHWQLEEVAYLLSKGKATTERLDTVADGLTALAGLLRKHHAGA